MHLRQQRQRFTEMQIVALTAQPETQKQVSAVLEAYRKQLFPGAETKQDDSMEQAKRALAEETKKVYMLRQLDSIPDLKASIQDAVAAGAPELAKAAAHSLKEKELQNIRLKNRMERLKKR